MKNIKKYINKVTISLFALFLFVLVGCRKNIMADGMMNSELKLLVDGKEVEVAWENNDSVKELSELAKQGDINIAAHRYGGFEQVGEIGSDIVSNNVQMTTEPGDIVLYNGNNIVVFFGNNSWSYTKLGKIKNKNLNELKELLDKNTATLTLVSVGKNIASNGNQIINTENNNFKDTVSFSN